MTGAGYKSGFFSIVGCPNVGKSTLINRLVGQKIAIVTDRAQTTRNRITGILTRKDYQMIFLDTPGMTKPRNKLGTFMQKTAEDASKDTEAILFVVDALQGVRERDREVMNHVKSMRSPVIVLINKCDAASAIQMQEARDAIAEAGFDTVLAISAQTGENLDKLEELLKGYLTEGPQYYPEDMVTDQPERVICAEIIREKALRHLRDEVPHGIGVEILGITAIRDGLTEIHANVYCEREAHKGIIIGHHGTMLQTIGTEARMDIERLLDCHVNLKLWVKIRNDWRNNASDLKNLGYEK